MAEIRKPAVPLKQGQHTLYFTTFTVRDFMRDGFYRVDHLDVAGGEGMQRLLNERRTKQFGADFAEAHKAGKASLPTSVFLATEGGIDFDADTKEIVFNTETQAGVCPFDVVDGQHRIKGLCAAVENAKDNNNHDTNELLDFPVSVIVAPDMNEVQRMLQFVVVNTKQQKVATGVKQHIIARFTEMDGVEELPYIPLWLKREIAKGDDARALEIVKHLNQDEKSPWHNLIQFADDARPAKHFAVKQSVIVSAIKKYLLTQNHMLEYITQDYDKQHIILTNYWVAVRNLFVEKDGDPRQSVAFKSIGLVFFLSIASPLLQLLARRGKSYTVEAFMQGFEDVASQYEHHTEVMTPLFWKKGSGASSLNRAAVAPYMRDFYDAVQNVPNA